MAHRDGQVAGSEPVWLTAGEAADAARVAHRQIAAWVASDELSARTGWRGGAEIRLVLLSDLEAIAGSIDLDCIRGSLDARGVFTGPRHSLNGSGGHGGGDVPDVAASPVEDPLGPIRPVEREWAAVLKQEIHRLRDVIATLREDHDTLERHLDTRVAVVNTRHLGSVGGTVVATAAPKERIGSSRGTVVAVAGGLMVGLFSAVFASVFLGRDSDPAEDAVSVVHAAEPAPAAFIPLAQVILPVPKPIPAAKLQVQPEDPAPAQTPSMVPVRPDRLHLPMALADIEPGIFSRTSSVLADCAYTDLVTGAAPGKEPSGELVLGPCFGPARRGDTHHLAVPGTHRVGNVSCCRHHAFVERMTFASTDEAARKGLVTEAEASLAEGVLPPLFRLRADRSAVRFLREETRGWESAGLDGSAGMLQTAETVHEWQLAVVQPSGQGVRVHLESWIEPLTPYEPGRRTAKTKDSSLRRFSMILLIHAAPRGDVLESFEWLTD